MMYGNGMLYGGGVMTPLMWLFMIVFWGFALFGLICAVRWLFNRSGIGDIQKSSETPLTILKKRYAHGEIDKAQFENMKKDLE